MIWTSKSGIWMFKSMFQIQVLGCQDLEVEHQINPRFGYPNPGSGRQNLRVGIQIMDLNVQIHYSTYQSWIWISKCAICMASKSRIWVCKSTNWNPNPGFGRPSPGVGHPSPRFGRPSGGNHVSKQNRACNLPATPCLMSFRVFPCQFVHRLQSSDMILLGSLFDSLDGQSYMCI